MKQILKLFRYYARVFFISSTFIYTIQKHRKWKEIEMKDRIWGKNVIINPDRKLIENFLTSGTLAE